MTENNTQGYKELAPGTTLHNGKYTIEKVIGEGGFGITYIAIQSGLDRAVCIKEFFLAGKCVRNTQAKTIHLQGVKEETFEKYRQAFVKEAKMLASLKHPSIVEVIDIFDENNTSYMVMPFIEGQSLQSVVDKQGTLSYPEAVNYLAQITNAVGYIHEKNILHRDIKPDNVMITADYKAILIDFGSAREFEHDKTQSHTSMLTHGYAPVEQYTTSSRKGAYTDIYAIGATFYFVLTGKAPLEAAARMNEQMPEPKELNPEVPDEANRTILKAMQIKAENRHQSVEEFMDDLRNVKPSTLVDETIGGGTTVVVKKNNNAAIFGIVAVLIVALLAGGFFWWNSQNDAPPPPPPIVVSVTGVTLDTSTLELTIDETETLVATVSPRDATNQNITWSSSNPSVATVDASGRVTAVSAGTAAIIAATEDGGQTTTANITVSSGVTETVSVAEVVREPTPAPVVEQAPQERVAEEPVQAVAPPPPTPTPAQPTQQDTDDAAAQRAREEQQRVLTQQEAQRLAQQEAQRQAQQQAVAQAEADQHRTGVVINGVRWATRNVGAPGSFAANPESAGMFFQWNRRQGWTAGGNVSGWNSSNPEGTSWTRANDPCPAGWRLPTGAELTALFNARCTFTVRNGVNGCYFGNAPNQIFMPAVGARDRTDGALMNTGIGYYWSSTRADNLNALYMNFSRDETNVGGALGRSWGLSVRCVGE